MMGHRERLKGGQEYEALSHRYRRVVNLGAGLVKESKRTFNKRVRKSAKWMADVRQWAASHPQGGHAVDDSRESIY